jgi:hypothetical protein
MVYYVKLLYHMVYGLLKYLWIFESGIIWLELSCVILRMMPPSPYTCGETQLAACREQGSSPKIRHLVQKHNVLCHVTMTTFRQNTNSHQQTLILSRSDGVWGKPPIGFFPVIQLSVAQNKMFYHLYISGLK